MDDDGGWLEEEGMPLEGEEVRPYNSARSAVGEVRISDGREMALTEVTNEDVWNQEGASRLRTA